MFLEHWYYHRIFIMNKRRQKYGIVQTMTFN